MIASTHAPDFAPQTSEVSKTSDVYWLPFPRRGFTLLELLVAMTIFSVLLAGLGSAMMLARRAVPDGKKGTSAVVSAAGAMDRLAGDLAYATSIFTASPTELSFMVEDRNGDGSSEMIRYYWSGTPGAPLVRQVNGGAEATLLDGVQEFRLDYLTRSESLPSSYGEGDEILLASYDRSTYLSSLKVDRKDWCGEYFRPSLPSQVTGWRVTRVRFNARIAGMPTEEIKVQLRPAVGVLPADSVLAEVSVLENTLTHNYQWREVAFDSMTNLAPGSGLCLVVKGLVDPDACEVRTRPAFAYAPNCRYVVSGNSGDSWKSPDSQQLLFYVYGKVSTPNPIQCRYLLTGVQTTLRAGSDAASRLQTAIRVVNHPEVSGP
jgi:prepilin-type N-terminal cleavage/methylation domain-containing protein